MANREYGAGSIYQRGDRWLISYSDRGTMHRESTGGSERRDAVRLLKQRLTAIRTGKFAPSADTVTLADLRAMVEADYEVNGQRGLARIRLALRRAEDYFGASARATDITADRLTLYHKDRLKDGAAPATIALELSILKRGFSLAVRAGRLAS